MDIERLYGNLNTIADEIRARAMQAGFSFEQLVRLDDIQDQLSEFADSSVDDVIAGRKSPDECIADFRTFIDYLYLLNLT